MATKTLKYTSKRYTYQRLNSQVMVGQEVMHGRGDDQCYADIIKIVPPTADKPAGEIHLSIPGRRTVKKVLPTQIGAAYS